MGSGLNWLGGRRSGLAAAGRREAARGEAVSVWEDVSG
jgi:hypothetical protein